MSYCFNVPRVYNDAFMKTTSNNALNAYTYKLLHGVLIFIHFIRRV